MSHDQIQWDPNEQINLRYRLFARAIRINGLSQIQALQPYLQVRLEKTPNSMIEPRTKSSGKYFPPKVQHEHTLTEGLDWPSLQIAPIMRDLAIGMLGVYFFGEKLCKIESKDGIL